MRGRPDRQTQRNRKIERARQTGTEKLREAERQTETIRQTDVIFISSTPAVNSEAGCKFCQYEGGTTADTIPMTLHAVR